MLKAILSPIVHIDQLLLLEAEKIKARINIQIIASNERGKGAHFIATRGHWDMF